MATKAPPTIPPRPTRAPHISPPNADVPRIPPRPTRRQMDRSTSPNRDNFALSPLNTLPGETTSSNQERPSRPPSVAALPSVGQEGMEYENIEYQDRHGDRTDDQIQQPAETRNVNRDLYLHAPRPSLPGASAKAQVEVVTRTDSRQAAAAGFGKAVSPSNEGGRAGSIYSRTHGSQAELSTERRRSVQLDEHGIPEIGQRVPMIPNAGDVQAPTPAPMAELPRNESHFSPRPGRQHVRSRSGRENSLPPGSYGLHGHGVHSNDKFEKAWYDKHPEELAREEQGHYGPGIGSPRPEWALSSDDLNKIVKSSANRVAVLGTSAEVMGTPEEEIGYIATEELASRLASPPQVSEKDQQDSQNLQGPAELPSKKANFMSTDAQKHEHALAEPTGEQDKDGVKIHIDEPIHHQHHPDGFMPAVENHKPHGADSLDENEEDVPILAEDEVDERAEHLQPAVSPGLDKRKDSHAIDSSNQKGHIRSANTSSNQLPARQPLSTNLSRYSSRPDEFGDMRRPLEDVEEYEPLFPDDDKNEKPMSVEERLKKRPEYHQHRFPSQDIWEDAPDSLQLQTTVSIPESPKDKSKSPTEAFEEEMANSRQTASKKSGPPAKMSSSRPDILSPRLDAVQRFPSRDIWEEAPESQQLETTIQIPEQQDETISPEITEKPSHLEPFSRLSKKSQEIFTEPQASTSTSQIEPTVSPTDSKKPPSIPERPKPQIPARPSKPPKRISEESLSKATSGISNNTASPPAVKPKPPVPSRPLGSKIAALKAGFLSDLDNRLKLGPQAPKPQEKKAEENAEAPKGPLSDARKGRARGPARRKPAVSPSPEDTCKAELPQVPQVTLIEPWNIWSMGPDGVLVLSQENKQRESFVRMESLPPESKEPSISEKPKVDKPNTAKSSEFTSHSTESQDVAETSKPVVSSNEPDLPERGPIAARSPPSLEPISSKPDAASSAEPVSVTKLSLEDAEASNVADTKKTIAEDQQQENDNDTDITADLKAERTLSGASMEE
ncbi:hypothetical protein PRK78_000539 [Emydomyces testavorans]|uniref:Altered inheritance of mitochondria protein 21 n=1 Tax=Emydomyces testavorans TaxID=2070801 RepID=A0AAF0DAX1_9EURO|nr:hypothetical protein PRK78_000539 [Emydomyces testavorans]